MKRRDFITLLGGAAAAWPVRSHADQRRLAYVMPGAKDDPETQARHSAFRQMLESHGWNDGKNIQIDYRWGVLGPQGAQAAAPEIVLSRPEVIVVQGTPLATAIRALTSDIPIVFVGASDPLSSGLVRSLARPGANLTGFVNYEFSMGAKWVQTLKELVPALTEVRIFGSRDNAGNQGLFNSASTAAPQLGVTVIPAFVSSTADIEDAFQSIAQHTSSGLVVLPTTFALDNRRLLLKLCSDHRIPAIYPLRIFTIEGGLLSLDTDATDYYGRAASYVDRILRGERAGDLPVQVPTRYQLAINSRTCRSLGITVPVTLLGRADEVIE